MKGAANGAAASTHLEGYGPNHLSRWQSEESLSQIHVRRDSSYFASRQYMANPLEYVNEVVNES